MKQQVSIEKGESKKVQVWIQAHGMGQMDLVLSDEEALEFSAALREAVQSDRFREDMVFGQTVNGKTR